MINSDALLTMRDLRPPPGSDLILRSIAERCVSKDAATLRSLPK
jgi:hypothetical protein